MTFHNLHIYRAVSDCPVFLSHGHAPHSLLLLMVIRLVAHRNLLLLDLPPEFSIHLLTRRDCRRHGVVLEDPAHVVEQACDGKEHIGPVAVVKVIQKELCILVSLGCRLPEPVVCLLLILRHFFPCQVQLTQGVLRVLVALFGRLGQIAP